MSNFSKSLEMIENRKEKYVLLKQEITQKLITGKTQFV